MANEIGGKGRRTNLIKLLSALVQCSCITILAAPALVVEERGVPDFDSPAPPTAAPNCSCVDCGRADIRCGGLWKGLGYAAGPLSKKEVHIVVSHCKTSLGWIPRFTDGYEIASIQVLSKCKQRIDGAPDTAGLVELPNTGRCDHSYAKYISTYLGEWINPDAVVFFLKDNTNPWNLRQAGQWNNFTTMLETASSPRGFACGVVPDRKNPIHREWVDLSVYHKKEDLFLFSLDHYESQERYRGDGVAFKSQFDNLGQFYEQKLGSKISENLPELVPVCYGGIFAASVSSIRKVPIDVWRDLEEILSRGDNIEEGHFMERLWALLLTPPLEPHEVNALMEHTAGHTIDRHALSGVIGRKHLCRSMGKDGWTKTNCTLKY